MSIVLSRPFVRQVLAAAKTVAATDVSLTGDVYDRVLRATVSGPMHTVSISDPECFAGVGRWAFGVGALRAAASAAGRFPVEFVPAGWPDRPLVGEFRAGAVTLTAGLEGVYTPPVVPGSGRRTFVGGVALAEAAQFASDDARPMLACVAVGQGRVAVTDSYRIHAVGAPLPELPWEPEVLIPAWLAALFGDNITVSLSETGTAVGGRVSASWAPLPVTDWPLTAVRRILYCQPSGRELKLDRPLAVEALKGLIRAVRPKRDDTCTAKFEADGDGLKLTVGDDANCASAPVPGSLAGEPVCLEARRLVEMLSLPWAPEVTLCGATELHKTPVWVLSDAERSHTLCGLKV